MDLVLAIYLPFHFVLGFYGWGWHWNNLDEKDKEEINPPLIKAIIKAITVIVSILIGPFSFLAVYINSKIWGYKLKNSFKFW